MSDEAYLWLHEGATPSSDITDHKVMCFGGEVRCEFACTGRAEGDLRVDFIDTDWNRLPLARHCLKADAASREQTDYKFYCFDGEPGYLYVSQGLENHETARISFLNVDEWSFAPFGRSDYVPFEELPSKPMCYDEMFGLACELSAGMPFVRADFLVHAGRPRFSEMTFHPCAGLMPFKPSEWGLKLGSLMNLPAFPDE